MALSVFMLSQIVFAILILIKLFWNFWSKKSCPNPFAVDDRKPRKPYITDQRYAMLFIIYVVGMSIEKM